MNRAVFLDRDGVLTAPLMRDGKWRAPERLEDFRIVPEAVRCVQSLKAEGYLTLVVSNQPEVATGRIVPKDLEEMHRRLRGQVQVDDVYVCPHQDEDRCVCRKPKPGLILRAAVEHGVDPCRSFLIGDSWRDIEAGRRAGCTTILLEDKFSDLCFPSHRVTHLFEAVDLIVQLGGVQ